ncbi:MAG TPA: DUF1080 domain-containing protein [Opitutaceae bacterium]|nr:DUF1080 domain-containing protein [Opitutaceae bacterium]
MTLKPRWFVCLILLATLTRLGAGEANSLTAKEKADGWKLLFDGKSLSGWRPSTENPSTFSVKDGILVVAGPRSHLFYEGSVQNHDFKNFELQLDVKTYPKGNSGVYFHTVWQDKGWPSKGYEVQVNNSHKDPKRTAGIYGIKDNYEAPVKDGEWFTLRIKVEGKKIETFVNGRPISSYTEEDKPERPANFAGRLLDHGTFAIQGHDPESRADYRNIKVRVLP